VNFLAAFASNLTVDCFAVFIGNAANEKGLERAACAAEQLN
jgi:hypothetical protein